ncbi:hypothetical protein [Allocoleopsis sp.]
MNENLATRPFVKDAYTLVPIREILTIWVGQAATAQVQECGYFSTPV